MSPLDDSRASITPVGYRAQSSHHADLEVVDAAELGRRILAVPDRGVERVDLHCVLYVSGGSYEHMVDFRSYSCSAGTAITVRPGQVHRFGPTSGWDGWFVVLRPEHSNLADPPDTPAHAQVAPRARPAIEALFGQMAQDADSDAPLALTNVLLLTQFEQLVIRLRMNDRTEIGRAVLDPSVLTRFGEFRAHVECEHARWRTVAPYARRIGCSERSLARATEAVTGVTAKRFITQRVVLEAKRLLAHGSDPVSTIAARLGFDEATNFVKYFRRETGTTPMAFRTSVLTPDPLNGPR